MSRLNNTRLLLAALSFSCGGCNVAFQPKLTTSDSLSTTDDETILDGSTAATSASDSGTGTTFDSTTTTTASTGTTTTDDPSDADTTSSSSTTEDSIGTTETNPQPPDQGCCTPCDTYNDECPAGQKCTSYADDGGSSWNNTKCVEIMGDGLAGEPCSVEGSAVSGLDDCAQHHICWDVDYQTSMGTCVAFCEGTSEDPSCEDPNNVCTIANEGALNLCLPGCAPLLQDCIDGEACYPLSNGFICAPMSVGNDSGFEDDPCEFVNACQVGLMCAETENLPDCITDECCTPFCDLDDVNTCQNGKECVPVYPDEESIRVGFCGVMP